MKRSDKHETSTGKVLDVTEWEQKVAAETCLSVAPVRRKKNKKLTWLAAVLK